ncbi:MAG: hypothetical protein ABSA91_02770 [Acidimicrobiales bacterium]
MTTALDNPPLPIEGPGILPPRREVDGSGQWRNLLLAFIGPLVIAAVFVALLLSAFHQPIPHALPVGVVAHPAVARQLQVALDTYEPGGFDLRSYSDVAEARVGVIDGDVDASVTVAPGGLRLLTAGAGGVSPVQTLTGAFDAVAAQTGQRLSVVDLVPPLSRDSEGFSAFFLVLGVLFPSLIVGVGFSLALKNSPLAWRLGVLVLVPVLLGVIAASIADEVAGFGNFPTVAGIVALFSLAVSVPTAALARIRPVGIVLAFLVFTIFAIPVSGGPGGAAPFAPGFERLLDPVLPLGVAVDALRSAVYFHGHDVGLRVLVLALWAASGGVMLALLIFQRLPQSTTAPQNGSRRSVSVAAPVRTNS